MTRERTINSRLYSADTRVVDEPANSNGQYTKVEVELTRENWPAGVNFTLDDGTVQPNTAVVVDFQRTLNGGASWESIGKCTFDGGDQIGRDGNPVLVSRCSHSFTDAAGVPVAQPGNTRLVFTNLVQLRTAATFRLVDTAEA